MNVLILGGDLRYLEIIKELGSKYSVDVVGYKNTYIDGAKKISIEQIDVSRYDVIIFPVNGVLENNMINCRFDKPFSIPDNFLVGSRSDALIFSGISTPSLDNILNIADRNCIYLMKDNEVIRENSIPTVEGILADVISNTEVTVNNSNVLVFGYGNIGSVLVDYFKKLGANVSVAVALDDDFSYLNYLGIDCFYSSDCDSLINHIKNTDVIVNTVPSTVINDDLIKYINRDAYVLDIASHPHGICLEVMNELFIKNKRYLGIPGKVAPVTSGKILTKKINNILEGK